MSRSNGHCMTMGTASTMACMAEALGMQLPGSASWPAVDSRRYEVAQEAGGRIVSMVNEDLRPQRDNDPGCLRQRHQGQRRYWGLDQRRDPSDGHRGPAGREPCLLTTSTPWPARYRPWSTCCPPGIT